MAKRFIDSTLFRKPLVRALDSPSKLLWIYIQCECDHAGVWIPEMDVVASRLGVKMSEEKALAALTGLVLKLPTGEWFIVDFVPFQYGALNPANRAHKAVMDVLVGHGVMSEDGKVLVSPLEGCKDKEKDMEKEREGVQREGKSVTERVVDFEAEVRRIHQEKRILPEPELIKFIAYWCQVGNGDRKFHAEKQQSFEIAKRMITWAGKQRGWDRSTATIGGGASMTKEEAEAELREIRLRNGRDPVLGATYPQEKSERLRAYEKAKNL